MPDHLARGIDDPKRERPYPEVTGGTPGKQPTVAEMSGRRPLGGRRPPIPTLRNPARHAVSAQVSASLPPFKPSLQAS